MLSIDQRDIQARQAWRQGLALESAGELDAAYALFRQAHDLVVDCPRLHQQAHQHLRRLNVKRRSWRELGTDLFLLGLAGVGIFELVAFMMKGQVLGGVICGRGARAARGG